MKKFFLTLVVILSSFVMFCSIPNSDDVQRSFEQLKKFKIEEAKRKSLLVEKLKEKEKSSYKEKQPIDMLHYDFDLKINPHEKYIGGTVTLTFKSEASISSLNFSLHKKLNLIGAKFDDLAASVKRNKDVFTVQFPQAIPSETTHRIAIEYDGEPKTTGSLGGGMFITDHNGVPCATSLSEPFEAYAWVPIIDEVSDKFTANINLTVPSDMVGASNGVLVDTVDNGDGFKTYKWQENYPISAYLISANVTNYDSFEDFYTSLDGQKTMPIKYYVYPEHLEAAQENFNKVPTMITLYANYAGEYPFIDEKYGMVEFPWGGGMEHQTLTSMGDYFIGYDVYYNNLIYAHELSHQWFGDSVTCGTWHDIWLNEGFATYFEVLWFAYEYSNTGITIGDIFSTYYDDGSLNGYLKGSVYVQNENKPFADSGAIYEKGGWVLYMLQNVMGDDKFWQAMNLYRNRYNFSNAVTSDFQSVCEEVYGDSLQWFFDEWVYTKKRPVYSFSYSTTPSMLNISIAQKQKHKIANRSDKNDVYIMPIEVTVYYDDGSEEVVKLWNDEREQNFEIPVSKVVSNVVFDKNHKILKVVK